MIGLLFYPILFVMICTFGWLARRTRACTAEIIDWQ